MEARDHEIEKELAATLQARRELGPEYESALIDSFLEKVEQRLDTTLDRRVRRHLAEQQVTAARDPRSIRTPSAAGAPSGFGERFGFGVVSLVLAVPLSAIGVVNAGIEGLVVARGAQRGPVPAAGAGAGAARGLRFGLGVERLTG
ncbi:hypothetical protein ABZ384_13805 [Streptomyces cyaneofuscatus]|uniref:hypothetical protein n=1 Tax=Streptomyces cyaneofuscatus TaxID=66883 RepID=UPI0033D1A38D